MVFLIIVAGVDVVELSSCNNAADTAARQSRVSLPLTALKAKGRAMDERGGVSTAVPWLLYHGRAQIPRRGHGGATDCQTDLA